MVQIKFRSQTEAVIWAILYKFTKSFILYLTLLLMSVSLSPSNPLFIFLPSPSHLTPHQPPVLPGWRYLFHYALGCAGSGKPTDWPKGPHRLPRGGESQEQERSDQGDQLGPRHHTGTHLWTHGECGSVRVDVLVC